MTPDGNPTFDPSQPFQTVGAQPAAPAASGAPAFDASKPFDVVPTPRQFLSSLGAEGPQTQQQPLPQPEVTPQAVIAATSPQAEAPKPEPVAPFAGEPGHMETPQAAEAPVTGDDVRAAMRGMPPELQMSPAGYGGEEPLATIGREAFNAATTPGPSVTALKAEIFRPRTPEEVQEALDLAEAGKYSPDAAVAALSIKSIAKDAGLAVGSVLDAVGGAFNGAAAGAQQALMSAGLPEEKAGALVEAAQLIGMDVGAAMPTVPPVGSRYLPKPIAPEDMEILRGTAGQRPRPGGLPQPPEPIEGTATSVPEPPPQGPAPGGAPAATPAPGRPGRATRPIPPMPEITTIQELEDELDRTDGAGTRDKPMDIRSPGDLAVASQNVNTEPSGAQVEAGNYKKGHGTFQGLPVTIETPAGAERRGVGPDGQAWSVMLQHPYGYVKGTVGADGEHVDTYVGPHADSPTAFVVDQVDPSTGQFDEHKAVLGANTPAEAAQIYDAGFSDGSGPSRRAAITPMPMDEFKSWLKTGDTTAPAAPPPATARQLHDDILSGAVAPRAADVAKRYRIDPTQAARLLDQVSQRPDPSIELAGGKEAAQRPGGQYDPTAYTWRRIPDDRRESTLAGLNQWSDRMFGVSRRNFASDADFADAVSAARDRHQEVLARANELDIRPNQNATTEEVQAQIAEREAMMMEGEGHEQIDAHADGTERDIDAAVPHSLPETSDDIPGFGEPRAGIPAQAPKLAPPATGPPAGGVEPEPVAVPEAGGEGAAPNANRGPEAAGEGAGAPGGGQAAVAPVARPLDAHGNPIFQEGERVVLSEQGETWGRHGVITGRHGIVMRPIFGGGGESKPFYSYDVRTDQGFMDHSAKLEPETQRPERAVPDPIWHGEPVTPQSLKRGIASDLKSANMQRAAAARARKPENKRALERAAQEKDKDAVAKRDVLDAWREKHPDEAVSVLGERPVEEGRPIEAESPSAQPAHGMQIVETRHTRDNYPLFVVTMADRVSPERFSDLRRMSAGIGGHYSSFRGKGAVPGFQFKTREAAEKFIGSAMPAAEESRAPEAAPPNAPPSESGHYAAGFEARKEGKPRQLPSYFTTDKGKNPSDWLRGWDAAPAPAAQGWTEVGKNHLGQTLYQDARGVRSIVENGVRRTEPVSMVPTREGVQIATDRGNHPEYRTADETAEAHGAGTAQEPSEEPQPEPQPQEPPQDQPGYGTGNKTFTADAAARARARLRAKLNQLNAGLDPEAIMDGIVLAGYHIEAGARAFAEFSRAMLDDLGEKVQPYLRQFYEMVRHQPGFDTAGMTPAEEIDRGLQGAIPPNDAGQRPGAVHGTPPEQPAGPIRPAEVDGSAPNAPGPPAGQGVRPGVTPGGGGGGNGGVSGLPGAGKGPKAGAAGRPEKAPDADVTGKNFTIAPGATEEGRSFPQKSRDNIAAIELAKQLLADNRLATKSEQAVLAKYVGWGGLRGAFDAGRGFGKGFEDVGGRLKALLTPEEYQTAAKSTQYAHYTAEHVVRSMWDAVRQMGFDGGNVFEPGMGVGHFLGMAPPDIAAKMQYQGLELDHLTADIAKLLYPESGVRQADFTRTPIPEGAFDLAIGNPPFSDVVIRSDPKYSARGFMLHDYFFAKSLDSIRPGALMAYVTSAGTMNKLDPAARHYMAERADFLGGIRLPSTAFAKNAGTEVTTDVLFFKKLAPHEVFARDLEAASKQPSLEGGVAKPSWTETVVRTLPNKDGVPIEGNVSRYFSEHPEMVLGDEGFFDKLYQDRYAVHGRPGQNLETELRAAVERLPRDVMTPPQTPEERAALDFASGQHKEGSFYVAADGRLMQYSGGAGRPIPRRGVGVEGGYTLPEIERIHGLIPIRDALRDVFKADLAKDDAAGATARAALNKHYDAFVKKFGPINKAEFQYRRPTAIQQEAARAEAREEARDRGEQWNEGDFDDAKLVEAKATLSDIARQRQAARDAARKAVRGFDEGSFNPDDMSDVVIERRPNVRPFRDDPESYRLRAIEDYNDATGEARKKDIFDHSILTHYTEPEIKSPEDAILWSLNANGRLDLDAMAAKLKTPVDNLLTELGDRVFKVPGTRDTYQTADEYLSGDVVSKLEQARTIAERDPSARANVEALEKAQPVPLAPSEISMGIGASWVPEDTYARFAAERLNLGKTRVHYSKASAQWLVTEPHETGKGAGEWGTQDVNAYGMLKLALNRVPIRIYRDEPSPSDPRRTVRVFDEVATQAAQDKVDAMKQAFDSWLHSEPETRDQLAQIYNGTMNRVVPRVFDGSYLTTPGSATDWSWRPHQLRAISRVVLTGNTYLAHAVGSGKTSEYIGAGMEMRRLGLVRKPMYVVPNHMLAQFSKEFYETYPLAKIAIADERAFHTDRRKQFVASVAQDDLDGVVITNSAFGKIPVSEDFAAGIIQEQIDDLAEAIGDLDPDDDKYTIRRLENMKEKLEQRLSRRGAGGQDQVNTFEEMGVDFLFVDEAHQFRKLSYATKLGSINGIDPDGSGMAWDLYTKVRYLDSQRPGRAAVFGSGTPVTNTMGELYSISRYLQQRDMEARGVQKFDAWASTFGDVVTKIEQNAQGGYDPVTRFAKFVNMPELYKMVAGVMDIVTPTQLAKYVVRPKLQGGQRQFHLAPRTDWLDAFQNDLGERVRAIKLRKGPPQKGDDIILSVINDGRLGAIDPRFFTHGRSNEVDPSQSKLSHLVDNVHQIWKDTKNQQFYDPATDYQKPSFRGPATQMVFSNMGIDASGTRGFSAYAFLKRELIKRGVPANEIAFIKDYKSHVAKQKLFNDMNEGKVRILVGSVQKMGTGVNAQRRLIANHNLDPLWYPADDEQRNGRILRQGNHNPEIQIHDYSTKGTYDATMWQLMGNKGRFIEQFFRGDPELRDMEDLGEAGMFEQASAMSTSDERVIRLTELRQALDKATRREAAHEREEYSMRRRVEQAKRSLEYNQEQMEAFKSLAARYVPTRGDAFKMRVGDQIFTKRPDANKEIERQAMVMLPGMKDMTKRPLGELGGFPVSLERNDYSQRGADGKLHGVMGHAFAIELEDGKNLEGGRSLQALENKLADFGNEAQHHANRIVENQREIATYEPQLGKPFTGGPEIVQLRHAVGSLEAQLGAKDDKEPLPTASPELLQALAEHQTHLEGLATANKPLDAKEREIWDRVVELARRDGFKNDQQLMRVGSGRPQGRGVMEMRRLVDPETLVKQKPDGRWYADVPGARGSTYKDRQDAVFRARLEVSFPREPTRTGGDAALRAAIQSGDVKRGARALIDRLRLEENLGLARNKRLASVGGDRATLSPGEAREVEDFIDFVGHRMFDDVGLRVMRGPHPHVMGQYEVASHVVRIFRAAIDGGMLPRTAVHELWHSLEQALSREDREAVIAEFQRQRENWLRTHEWARPFVDEDGEMEPMLTGAALKQWEIDWGDRKTLVKIEEEKHLGDGRVLPRRAILPMTSETYRYTNASEYFAETMTDKYFSSMDLRDAKVRSIWGHIKAFWGRMVAGFKRLFGRDATGRIFEGFGKGEYEPPNRGRPTLAEAATMNAEREQGPLEPGAAVERMGRLQAERDAEARGERVAGSPAQSFQAIEEAGRETPEAAAARARAQQKTEAEARMAGRKVGKRPGQVGKAQESAEELPLFGGKRQGSLFSIMGEGDETPTVEETTGPLGRGVATARQMVMQAADKAQEVLTGFQMAATPMALGTEESRAVAKTFANSQRRNDWEFYKTDRFLEKNFTPARRREMFEALDEESVRAQLRAAEKIPEGEPGAIDADGRRILADFDRRERDLGRPVGLDRLDSTERAAVTQLNATSKANIRVAKRLGMYDGEGIPWYAPRYLVEVVGGEMQGVRSESKAPRQLDQIGKNLKTTSSRLLHRKHLTAEETEEAAQKALQKNVAVVRDIRAVAHANRDLQRAIAGRALIERIRKIGHQTGQLTVSDGALPNDPTQNWFTIPHPAFFRRQAVLEKDPDKPGSFRPVRDSDGNVLMSKVPIYVRGDFEGPLRAVLSTEGGAIYRGFMALKGKTMSVIMYSPVIHNQVEWGRALPAMPGKVATFRIYFEGNAAKRGLPYAGVWQHIKQYTPGLSERFGTAGPPEPGRAPAMVEAINAGMVPIGHWYGFQDISSVLEQPNIAAGRSWTAQLLGAIPGLFDERAGEATMRAIDRVGNVWHNALLWDRIGDLQMGLYVNLRDKMVRALAAKGITGPKAEKSAQIIAAHMANRYAGALPLEAMSGAARRWANSLLFSRSFTLGNLGVMKDAISGLPRDAQAQILKEAGPILQKFARNAAMRKAIAIMLLDIGLLYATGAILQSAIAVMSGDSTLDKEAQGYIRRWNRLMLRVKETPSDLLNPFWDVKSLLPQGENEPGKEDYVMVGYGPDGAVYMNPAVGKMGREFEGWATGPLDMLRRKAGTIAKPGMEVLSNDDGFGNKVYNPWSDAPVEWLKNIGRIAALFFEDQLPGSTIRAAMDAYAGRGDRATEIAQVLGPLALGATFSKGAPGGPAMAEVYRAKDRFWFNFHQDMPSIRRDIQDHAQDRDFSGAIKSMTAIGVPPGMQKYEIQTTLNPAAKFTRRQMKDFESYASPEMKQDMEHFLEEDRERAAPQ